MAQNASYQLEDRSGLKNTIEDNLLVSVTATFIGLSVVGAVVLELLGFQTMAGLMLAYCVITLVVSFFVVYLPVFALNFIE